jgi:hypothetical protein
LSLLLRRIRNQQLLGSPIASPAGLVSWFGAMQAQDYAGAAWAIGLRIPGLTEAGVNAALDDGSILRTHVLRPTWHFVTPADIRWMLALTAPRVQACNAAYYPKLSLDRATLARTLTWIERALTETPFLTRPDIAAVLQQQGLRVEGIALGFVMMNAELEGLICSGPRQGKQFTYALLERRAPRSTRRDRDDALGELARRYFTSHGPATLRDFAWWSGLTQRDGRRGIEVAGAALSPLEADGLRHWHAASVPPARRRLPFVHLLPNYDECLIAYQDRGLSAPPARPGRPRPRNRFTHHLLVDGRLAGSWQRTIRKDDIELVVDTYVPPTPVISRAIERAALRYGAFCGRPVRVRLVRQPRP